MVGVVVVVAVAVEIENEVEVENAVAGSGSSGEIPRGRGVTHPQKAGATGKRRGPLLKKLQELCSQSYNQRQRTKERVQASPGRKESRLVDEGVRY